MEVTDGIHFLFVCLSVCVSVITVIVLSLNTTLIGQHIKNGPRLSALVLAADIASLTSSSCVYIHCAVPLLRTHKAPETVSELQYVLLRCLAQANRALKCTNTHQQWLCHSRYVIVGV